MLVPSDDSNVASDRLASAQREDCIRGSADARPSRFCSAIATVISFHQPIAELLEI
jgi:hypothetical protein